MTTILGQDRPARAFMGSGTGNTNPNGNGQPRRSGDPAEPDPFDQIPGLAPNMGQDVLPHVVTFQGLLRNIARTYYVSDEAIKDSWDNARFMRNDPGIMECLEQRQRSTALLGWHLEPEDEKDATQKMLVNELTAILRQIPNFLKYRENLLHALWYGKYGISHRYRWKEVNGRMRIVLDRWRPVNGDKLVFRYDDGSGEFDDDQVGIRVGAGYTAGSQIANRWTIERLNKVSPTDHGLAYFLEHWERPLLAIHKHMIEDAEFEAPDRAGVIHGVGIRNRLYWLWYQKQETLAWLMEYLERSAFGIEIWSYPAGNPEAKQATRKAAEERIGNGRNIVLVPRHPDSDLLSSDVKRIEPGMAGADILDRIIREYFGWQIKRYILGQILTSEAASTGLGSGVASIHLDTYLQIIKYDSLNLGETLTTDLVGPLIRYNWPQFEGMPIRFVLETDTPDVDSKLSAWQKAYQMGLKIRAQDVADIIGAATAKPDEETLEDPQHRQAAIQERQQRQQIAQQQQAAQAGQAVPSLQAELPKLIAMLSGQQRYRRLRPGMERLIFDREGKVTAVERYRATPNKGKERGSSQGDDGKGGWRTLGGGAHVHFGADGLIAAGCAGLKGEDPDDLGEDEEPGHRQRREHRQDVAEHHGLEGDDLTHQQVKQLEQHPHPDTGRDASGRQKAAPPVKRVKLGNRDYEVKYEGGSWFFRLNQAAAWNQSAAWSQASDETAAAIERQMDDIPFDLPEAKEPVEEPQERTKITINPRTRVGKAILTTAQDWGLAPDDLAGALEYLWEQKAQEGAQERTGALQAARKLTGLYQSDVKRLKNAGYDYTSGKRVPGVAGQKLAHFDEYAQEIAREYPILGLGDPDDPNVDFGAALWDVLDEDRGNAISMDDPELLRQAAELVLANQQHDEANVLAGSYEEFCRRGEVERYRRWQAYRYGIDSPSERTEAVERAAAETDQNPTEAEKEAGNYRKGRCRLYGMEVAIENPKGSIRSGKNRRTGETWSIEMPYHYGYLKRTESEADGDHIDVFIGPDLASELVFVVDQVKPGLGHHFDEHKVMLGWKNAEQAKRAYHKCYNEGWQGFESITPMSIPQFRAWLESGDSGKRIAGQAERYRKAGKGQASFDWNEDAHPRDADGKFAEGAGEKASVKSNTKGTDDGKGDSNEADHAGDTGGDGGKEGHADREGGEEGEKIGDDKPGAEPTPEEKTRYEDYIATLKAANLKPKPLDDWLKNFRSVQGRIAKTNETERPEGGPDDAADDTTDPPAAEDFTLSASDETTPREAAEEVTRKQADSQYAYARKSAIPNSGKDILGSARHKANAWRGLEHAEENGTAAALITRENLLKNEPHGLMTHVMRHPLSSLAMYYALRNFPAKPGYGKGTPSPDDAKKNREQYVDAYKAIKDRAEELAASQEDPIKACRSMATTVNGLIQKYRETDRYNSTANGLVNLLNKLSLTYGKTSIAHQVGTFAKEFQEAYPDISPDDKREKAADHAGDIIDGASLNKTFGKVSDKKKTVNTTDFYEKEAKREGGPEIARTAESARACMESQMGINDIQFGNYVPDPERAHHLKRCAEAFTDLSDILKIPSEYVSWKGKLGMAFGARGSANASAHYEPAARTGPETTGPVINLTRASGAGCLAHEWGHFFDHMIGGGGVSRKDPDKSRSEGNYFSEETSPKRFKKDPAGPHGLAVDEQGRAITIDKSDDPLWKAFDGVREAQRSSGFVKRLGTALHQAERDGLVARGKRNYFMSGRERFARCFERYVQRKLEKANRKNTYLAGMLPMKYAMAGMEFWPTDEEVDAMMPAFDGIFDEFRKGIDKGRYWLREVGERVVLERGGDGTLAEQFSRAFALAGFVEQYGRKPGKGQGSFDWDESKHPRAADGKFGSGGGVASAGKKAVPVHEVDQPFTLQSKPAITSPASASQPPGKQRQKALLTGLDLLPGQQDLFDVDGPGGEGSEPSKPDPKADWKARGVRSTSFKAWFGDWEKNPAGASKVVDPDTGEPKETYDIPGTGSAVKGADGKPLAVYHGTSHGGFTTFDKSKLDQQSLYGPGFYFTEDMEVAKQYQNKGAGPVNMGATQYEEFERRVMETLPDGAKLVEIPADSPVNPQPYPIVQLRLASGDAMVIGSRSDAGRWEVSAAHLKLLANNTNGGESLAAIANDLSGAPEVKSVFLNIRKPMAIDQPFSNLPGAVDALLAASLQRLSSGVWKAPGDWGPIDTPEAIAETQKSLAAFWDRYRDSAFTPQDALHSITNYVYSLEDHIATDGKTKIQVRFGASQWPEFLSEAGFDGITHQGGDRMGGGHHHQVWIAFEPNQIKSTENEGTFDPTNPDIRYSKGWATDQANTLSTRLSRAFADAGWPTTTEAH